ncbi:conserved hypothetical protein [Bradyrhizobium sp. ORS 278]|nr:conserved hypothetical protein [Bradyrhizobium sp. ORS 278]
MRKKSNRATFSDNVKVVQGDTTMRSKSLEVLYASGQQRSPNANTAKSKRPLHSDQPGPSGNTEIKRLEAGGGVVVTRKDQTASGQRAVFDTKTNLISMLGDVVLTQCGNVLRGDRLLVDMTTGVSHVEVDKGRVTATINRGSGTACQPPSKPTTIAPKPRK